MAAAETGAATTTNSPTEISLAELVKMEIPVVEAASKYKQKTTEAPSSVTIITAEEVKKFGHRTLADILASAPGLYVTYDRSYSFLGVRGFNRGDFNSRVLLLVDGHRVNNSLSDGAFIGTEFILDTDLIDRVEIIRGPGSSLYGNNAFFGVINVITRKGREMSGLGGEVSGEAASFDSYKGRATYGQQFNNGLELLFSGTIYDSRGQSRLFYKEFNTTNQNNGIAENADDDAFKSFFSSVAYRDFSLEGAFITREKGNPTAQTVQDFGFNDPRLRTTDDRGYATLKYAHDFPEVVEVAAQVYYDRHTLAAQFPFNNPINTLVSETQAAEWWGTDVQFTKRLADRHTLTMGGEYRSDFRQEQRQTSDNPIITPFDPRQTNRENYGIYLQGDFAVLTNLHFNAGARYDQYGDFDPAFNPRLALIYNPVGQAVFKALYGTAFRAPNFFELRHNPSPSAPPPPGPESITTYELVYEQGIGEHLRSSVAGYFNQIDDLITFRNGFYQNLDNAEAKGVEFALEGLWASGLRGRASYSFQETKDVATGRELSDSPNHLGKLNLSVPVWKEKVFADVEFLYVSRRNTEAGTVAAGYGIVNLTLFSQDLVKGLDFSASVYNLLDRKYDDPATPLHKQDVIEQDGRTFRVKLTYHF